ncbi:MAG: SGNH/GDSL hydrolase family protein [Candidatus Zipacnadales bacterium]
MAERPRLYPGDRLLCIGDSITADPEGYVTLVREVLRLNGSGVEVINAGQAGDTAADMAARLRIEIRITRPSWVSISAGANDALQEVSVEEYARSIETMIEMAEEAAVSVALCTPTPFEPLALGIAVEEANARIAQYVAWITATAKGQDLLVVPMFDTFRLVHEASDPTDPLRLTHDGIHMSPQGRYLMGLTLLAAFGVSLGLPIDKASMT